MKNEKSKPWSIPLWDFALNTYACEGVKEKCLSLQDIWLGNVNVMLWCCWLGAQSISLPRSALAEVQAYVDTIDRRSLLKLRSVRRQLNDVGAFSAEEITVIRQKLLEAELLIEKVQLNYLQGFTLKHLSAPAQYPEGSQSSVLSLVDYFRSIGVEQADKEAESLSSLCGLLHQK